MTVNEVYEIVLYAIRKNGGQGDLSPDEFNLLAPQAERSFLDYLLGEFQQYQIGRPTPRVQYGNNAETRQRLIPIIYKYNLPIDSTGFSPYPGNYEQADAMWSLYGFNRIRYAQQDQLWSYYNSRIEPYRRFPFYLIEDLGFRVFPNEIGTTTLSYVRTPNFMHWGYTIDGNGLPEYDPTTSQNSEFYDVDMLEIIARILRLTGVNLELNVVSQYATEIKQTGQ